MTSLFRLGTDSETLRSLLKITQLVSDRLNLGLSYSGTSHGEVIALESDRCNDGGMPAD